MTEYFCHEETLKGQFAKKIFANPDFVSKFSKYFEIGGTFSVIQIKLLLKLLERQDLPVFVSSKYTHINIC